MPILNVMIIRATNPSKSFRPRRTKDGKLKVPVFPTNSCIEKGLLLKTESRPRRTDDLEQKVYVLARIDCTNEKEQYHNFKLVERQSAAAHAAME